MMMSKTWLSLLLCIASFGSGMNDACAAVYDVYILTGQSNSLGTTSFDGETVADYGPGEHEADAKTAFFWSNVHSSNRKYPPMLYGDSDGKITSIRMQQGDGKNNPHFWGPEFGFARVMAGATDNKVLVIKASRGGGGNGYWDKRISTENQDAGHMWQHLCDTVDAALNVLAKQGDTFNVRGLIYVQGESNSLEESHAAGKRLAALHENLQEHINAQYDCAADSMKLVIGEIAASQNTEARKRTTQQQQGLAERDASYAFVSTRDLPLQPDDIHFGKQAKLEIGTRVAHAFRSLTLIEEQRRLVTQAQKTIQAWREAGDGDVKGDRPLIITLFTGSDTEPAPKYRERLTRSMKHIQDFYAGEMGRHGFGPLTFDLQTEEDGSLKIHVVRGDRPNDQYDGKDGQAIREIVLQHLDKQGIDGSKQTVVIFCNLTKWDPKTRKMSHHSPYYAGGSHQAGTAWQLDSALLDVAEIGNTDKGQYLHDGQYGHISLGRYQSIFVGGICHELGHALGLPHNCQRQDEEEQWGTALMGSGNFTYGQELREEGKGSFLTLAHAMKLAVHPGFSGSIKQMRQGPRREVKDLEIELIQEGKAVRISGDIDSDIPAHAVLVYLDPEGNSDYNATTHVAAPDEDGRFSVDCDSFVGAKGDIRLVYVHANGWSAWNMDELWPYTRSKEGQLMIGAKAAR